MFTAAAEAAGVTATFHALRHTFAAAMLRFLQREAQTNPELNPLLTLQVLLGHADIATTQIYTKVLEERLRAVMELHHPLSDAAVPAGERDAG